VNLTIRQLKVFEAVANLLSYTRAAEALHLSQPAVSMQIRQMEENIGLPLFEQLGKKVFLTEAGREMQRCAVAVLDQLKESEQIFEELKGVVGGQLSLAVATTVNYFATKILAAFNKEYPNIKISLEVTNREGLIQKLVENEADIVLMGKPPEDMDLEADVFMENPLVIIAPPGHHMVDRPEVSMQELAKETFLMREPGSGTRIAVERYCSEGGISLIGGGMEMNSNEAIKQGVQAGLGLGVVSIHTVQGELDAGTLKVINASNFPIIRYWYIVYRQGKRLSATARAFRDFVLGRTPLDTVKPVLPIRKLLA
jgi:DNA-binding transcriptional LysR family regulator